MIRLFKHYVPYAVLLLGLVDAVLLIASAEIGWIVRARQIGMAVAPIHTRIAQLVTFALALQVSLVAVGAYGVASFLSLRFAAARLAVALSLGVIFLSLIFFLVPPLALWRSNLLYATVIATVLLVTVRALLGKTLGGETFKRRIIVLGAGMRAARIEALAAQNEGCEGYEIVVARDRAQALDAVRAHEPAVVTLDLGLPPDPDGVTEGFATLRDILAMKPDTKVIVASGHGARDRALRAIYGVALAASGHIDGARQLLDKAVRLAPGDPAIVGHRRQLG
jgi:hypothetical protein